MGKIINKDNFRVVIYPRKYWLFRYPKTEEEKYYRDSCEEILDKLKENKYIMERTIDASIEFDTDDVCQYCGTKWRNDGDENYDGDPNYNGGCCDADEAAHQEYLKRTRIEGD
jgi:hypothetical protein